MAEAMKETGKAKKALEEYLLLGPDRSLVKLAKAMGKADSYVALLERWSKAHQWQKRVREYDAEQAEKRRREIEAEREKIDREHLLLGRTQALLAVQMIADLKKRGEYSLSSANQLLKISTDLQRLAIGSATQQIALTGKDGGPIEQDVIVETFWGRGTDPRKKVDDSAETGKEGIEESETDEEDSSFGIDIPEDDE
jgi:hypothetical protein